MKVKDEILEIVRKNIDQKKLNQNIDKALQEYFKNILEDGTNYIEIEGCIYDDYIDNLQDFSEILKEEADAEIINKLIEILKEEDVANFEIFEEMEKGSLTIEEIIKKINPYSEVSEYEKFYPKDGNFVSLSSSDRRMIIVENYRILNIKGYGCSLKVRYLDENNIKYLHPLTNALCDDLRGVLAGFSEQNNTLNESWEKLIQSISNLAEDIGIEEYIDNELELDIEKTPY